MVIALPCLSGSLRIVVEAAAQEVQHSHEVHDANYDHKAFLGADQSEQFDNLSPAESRNRLEQLARNKLDANKDGRVTEDELRDWIAYSQKRYIHEDVDRQWKAFGRLKDDETLSWAEMLKTAYGFDSDEEAENAPERHDTGLNHRPMVERDRERFKAADEDNNDILTKKEFHDFLHPEDAERMHAVVVKEALLDLDRDKDGRVDVDEYLHDIYPELEDRDAELPHWYGAEKENFAKIRDKNGDGYMDENEVSDWLLPKETDFVTAEAKHLINQADADRDGVLTIEEILISHDVFVGSQATDFGSQLQKPHDEL